MNTTISALDTALLTILGGLVLWSLRVSYTIANRLYEFQIRYASDHITRAEHEVLRAQIEELAQRIRFLERDGHAH